MQNDVSNGEPIIIDPSGDLVLLVSDQAYSDSVSYRVTAQKLRETSRYFNVLLDPSKFSEGVTLKRKLKDINEKYSDLNNIPYSDLPSIPVRSVGSIGKVTRIKELFRDFLLILHHEVTTPLNPKIPLSNLANLSIVADHFDALDTFKSYAHKNGIFSRVTKTNTTPKKLPGPIIWNDTAEEATRMRIMIGVLLGHQLWVQESENLIVRGSKAWSDSFESKLEPTLWWNLPKGLEGESNWAFLAVLECVVCPVFGSILRHAAEVITQSLLF
jgi:hypothetical protein